MKQRLIIVPLTIITILNTSANTLEVNNKSNHSIKVFVKATGNCRIPQSKKGFYSVLSNTCVKHVTRVPIHMCCPNNQLVYSVKAGQDLSYNVKYAGFVCLQGFCYNYIFSLDGDGRVLVMKDGTAIPQEGLYKGLSDTLPGKCNLPPKPCH